MKSVKLVPHESTDSRESIELDEYSEEDDVFLRNSAQNGYTKDAADKPLMKSKRRSKKLHPAVRSSRPKYCRCCGPLCWIILGFKSVIGLMIVTIVIVNLTTDKSWLLRQWRTAQNRSSCHGFDVTMVWTKSFPKLLAQGNFKLLSLVQDQESPDVLFGFGTGADGYGVPDVVCDIYFDGHRPCKGGVKALSANGTVLWTIWTDHEVFSVTCQDDLNKDGRIDCVGAGRAGLLFAFDTTKGKVLWDFKPDVIKSDLMSMYAAQFVHDLNGDGIPEVLAVHGGDPGSDPAQEYKMFGRIIIFDGSNGSILKWIPTPDRRESYYPPQILTSLDGEQMVLFGTGANLRSGSLYAISLYDLYKGKVSKAVQIYHDSEKGILNPAALVDINLDGIEDIILSSYNERVVALDGRTFKQLWNTTFKKAESYSSVAVGFFDEDKIPDFLVTFNYGKGYPVYEYAEVVVLSGRNGSVLKKVSPVQIGAESSPLTLSLEGLGNDIFLHWTSFCKDSGDKLTYSFPEYVDIVDQINADICHSLFQAEQVSHFVTMQRREKPQNIYDSVFWKKLEDGNLSLSTKLSEKYLKQHPEIQRKQHEYTGVKDESAYKEETKNWERELARIYAGGAEEEEEEDDDDSRRNNVVYVEGDNVPVLIPASRQKLVQDAGATREKATFLTYSQPHNIKKNPSISDTFEEPYRRRKKRETYQQADQHTRRRKLTSTGGSVDVDSLREAVTKCVNRNGDYDPDEKYDPFSLKMGQLTVFRMRLKCKCSMEKLREGETCGQVLDFSRQRWPSYMGMMGDSVF